MTADDHGPHSGRNAHFANGAGSGHGPRPVPDAHSGPGGDEGSGPFAELMAEVMAGGGRFGHRQHVHLTWLAVRRYGTRAAVGVVSAGIRRTARYAGAPQKYHATVSRAWVELVGHHADHPDHPDTADTADFDSFAAQHPALLDKKLLTRFYRSSTLADASARTGWVEPDLAPFPWHRAH